MRLTILASSEQIETFVDVAAEVPDVEVSASRSLDTSGDGLGFPLDPSLIIEGIKIVGTIVSTLNGLHTVFSRWRDRDKETESDTDKIVIVLDMDSGAELFRGASIGEANLEELAARAARSDDSD